MFLFMMDYTDRCRISNLNHNCSANRVEYTDAVLQSIVALSSMSGSPRTGLSQKFYLRTQVLFTIIGLQILVRRTEDTPNLIDWTCTLCECLCELPTNRRLNVALFEFINDHQSPPLAGRWYSHALFFYRLRVRSEEPFMIEQTTLA
jgi:hypothetical protein